MAPDETLSDWIENHPWTIGYIAVVVTVLLAISVLQLFLG